MTDEEFIARLTAYLQSDKVEPMTPVFRNQDGSINREKTLALPCYAEFERSSLKSQKVLNG